MTIKSEIIDCFDRLTLVYSSANTLLFRQNEVINHKTKQNSSSFQLHDNYQQVSWLRKWLQIKKTSTYSFKFNLFLCPDT